MYFIKKNQKGFASFEFVWTIPVFAFLFISFFDFFNLFNTSARMLVELHQSAFSTMGQVNPLVGSAKSTGLIYQGEYRTTGGCRGGAKCDGLNGEAYTSKKRLLFGGHAYRPMALYFDLKP